MRVCFARGSFLLSTDKNRTIPDCPDVPYVDMYMVKRSEGVLGSPHPLGTPGRSRGPQGVPVGPWEATSGSQGVPGRSPGGPRDVPVAWGPPQGSLLLTGVGFGGPASCFPQSLHFPNVNNRKQFVKQPSERFSKYFLDSRNIIFELKRWDPRVFPGDPAGYWRKRGARDSERVASSL